jgi:gas vesicle protein
MAKPTRTEITLWILAGIGAGTLLGATIGLLVGRRTGRQTDAKMAETVEALKERAEQVLGELSADVSDLVGRSRELLESPNGP